jgi:hypothetical protein
MTSTARLAVVTTLVVGLPLVAMAGPVAIDGQAVPDASSEVSIEKQVTEYRDGTSNSVQLVPGPATYRVCLQSCQLIPAVEAACAPGSDDPFVDVTVEDGRMFVRCLIESSNTKAPSVGKACGSSRIGAPSRIIEPPRPLCPECCEGTARPGTRYCFRCEGVQ